ncbi:hypothetical protein MCHI_000861 [Candidatus Magnetoovum chiemensis]|nr:hypothetical protein MCHI_000861 [Candidatus Magnetoovum chiemensis]
MNKKFMKILKFIANENTYDYNNIKEVLSSVNIDEYELAEISSELIYLELTDILTEDELDSLKFLLTYIIVRDSKTEWEDAYSLIFANGKRITWH